MVSAINGEVLIILIVIASIFSAFVYAKKHKEVTEKLIKKLAANKPLQLVIFGSYFMLVFLAILACSPNFSLELVIGAAGGPLRPPLYF